MAQSTPPTAAVRKLPVWATVVETYNFVFSNLTPLFRASVAPFLLSISVAALVFASQGSFVAGFVLAIIGFAPYALFIVAWCRIALHGSVKNQPPIFSPIQPHHWRIYGYFLLFFFATILLLLVFGFGLSVVGSPLGLDFLVPILAFLFVGYLMLRLSFVFPAIAVDENYGLKQSWAHTHGQGHRLLSAFVTTIIPIVFASWFLIAIIGPFLVPDMGVLMNQNETLEGQAAVDFLTANAFPLILFQLIAMALGYMSMALVFTLIAISFRTLTGWVPHTSPPTATSGDASFGDNV